MTLFLASVRDPYEAQTALACGADIIDLKEPTAGALGAVDRQTIMEIIRHVDGRAAVSATVGDLPMREDIVLDAVVETSACGIDYVKLGIVPDGDPLACLSALKSTTGFLRLIVVAFADRPLPFDVVAAAAGSGAIGIMLDTADKTSGSLPDLLDEESLAAFVVKARQQDLAIGLAGSLRAAHVQNLLKLEPDVLGFRGALCAGNKRDGRLDAEACRKLRGLIPNSDGSLEEAPEPRHAVLNLASL